MPKRPKRTTPDAQLPTEPPGDPTSFLSESILRAIRKRERRKKPDPPENASRLRDD